MDMPEKSAEKYVVKVAGHGEFTFDTGAFNPDTIVLGESLIHLRDDLNSWNIEVLHFDPVTRELRVAVNGHPYELSIATELDLLIQKMGFSAQVIHKARDVKAPMPGTVLDIFVEPGQQIHEGDKLLILEAMKMENVLKAPGDGVIKAIQVAKGSAVNKNEVLILLE